MSDSEDAAGHEGFLREAIRLSRRALERGDGPYGAVLVRTGAQQVDDAGLLGGVAHQLRLGRVAGERLLAQHVLAGCDRVERDRRVRERRRGDCDRVDSR